MLEAALLVICPSAETAVGAERSALDRSAQVGVPAHITVAYPFKPDLGEAEHRRLDELFGAVPSFTVLGQRTAWFDEVVLYVEPVDPAPLVGLTTAVTAAFPAYPPYGGAFHDVVPHLTIGHDHSVEVLRAAEQAVLARLPFGQLVDHVELWSGPALATAAVGSWRRVGDYPLATH
jgi:hypothetical protein